MGDFISVETQRKAMETKPEGMTDDQVIQGFLDVGDRLEGLNYEFFPVDKGSVLGASADAVSNVLNTGLNFLGDTVDIAKGIWALTKDQQNEQSGLQRVFEAPAVGLGNLGRSIFDLAEGLIQLGGTKLTGREIRNRPDKRAVAQAVINDYQQTYGSVEKFLNATEEHPGRILGDLSLILGVGAGVTTGRTAAKLGQLSRAVDPVSLPFRAAGRLRGTRAIAPFGGSVDQELAKIAKRRGIELTAGSLSESPAVAMTEKIAGRGFFGAKIIKKVEAATEKVNNLAEGLVSRAGIADKTTIGKNIIKGFGNFKRTFRETKTELYKQAELPKSINITTPETAKLQLTNIGDSDFIGYVGKDGRFKTIAEAPRGVRDARLIAEAEGYAVNAAGDVVIGEIKKTKVQLAVDASKTRGFVSEILAAEKEAAKITGKQRNVKLFNQLEQSLSKTQEASSVRQAIKQIDDLIDFKSPLAVGNQAILKRIRGSLANELDTAVKEFRPDLALAINEANALYSTNVQKLQSVWAKQIHRLKNQPDRIVETIINPKTSIEDIPRIFEVIGESNIPDVQAFVLDDIFTKARSATTKQFETAGITSQIKRYGDTKLRSILTSEQFDFLKDVETLARGTARGRAAVEGANVALAGRVGLQLGLLFTSPPLAIKAFLADLVGSRIIGSAAGQKLLTTGLNVNLKGVGARARQVGEVLRRNRLAIQGARILTSDGIQEVDNQEADTLAAAQEELENRPEEVQIGVGQ